MNCSEAVEWMHRYIDHDLDEEQSSVLFEHMEGCPECAEKFALLQELSAKLEDLPKVTPPFSLVDAILPQLDEIDRARREGGAGFEVLPASMVAEGTASELSRNERRRESGQRRGRIYRAGALGVAAAAILGIFIYQYEPQSVPEAEITSQTAQDNSANGTASSMNDSGDKANDAGESAPSEQAGRGSESGTGPQGDGSAPSAQLAPPSSETPVPSSGESKEADSQRGGKDAAPPRETGNADAPKQKALIPPARSKDEGTADGTKSGQAGNSQPAGQRGATDGNGEAANPDEGVADSMMAQELLPPQSDLDQGKMYGITQAPPTSEWTSSDGKYTAELRDNRLYVYQNVEGERQLLTEQSVDGKWLSGEWSDDGKTFTFETEKDGASSSHQIEPSPQEPTPDSGSNGSEP
ncbi:anti-sigma factor family protein [Paenibacillus sanfengchensis]|uniref:anti-sigma factor family protein n=1 Tax=Paenibacillus sanfengchensis TaxID=3119819 RepID=UPI002FE033C7